MGDFNSVLNSDDRIGRNPVSMAEIVDFHTCVEACGVMEMPRKWNKYTWNDRGDTRVFSKIDWVFINNEWLTNMLAFCANFLPEGVSDHNPVKIALLNSPRRTKPAFKYCNVWASHPKFLDIMQEEWNHGVEGYEDRLALAQAQAPLHLQPLDRTLQQQEKLQYLKFKRFSYLAEIFLQQMSKAAWIKLGDDNTRYFFSVIKHMKLQQTIIQMKDSDDVVHNDQQAIANIFVEYYKNLLDTKERHRTKHVGVF
ncbi:uncharacterized protein LOC132048730 [Lycium ferocissimum]|uniref:uncharacterized protein LOC132048730 n=1 Tax=Lycium ferocissimum TaxID=112874 RepID=UPI0028151488|nr:uncharacterized protein LOC132048730 [Lycium ferocissimum]